MVTTAQLVQQQEERLGLVKPPTRTAPSTTQPLPTQTPPKQRTELDDRKDALLNQKKKLTAEYKKTIAAKDKEIENTRSQLQRAEAGLSPGVSISKLRQQLRSSRKVRGYLVENYGVRLAKIDRNLSAVARAERTGSSYSQAKRVEIRKDPNYGKSTLEELKKKAAKGDEDAAKKVASKERFIQEATFKTRVIPKDDGPTTGKKTGVYVSPITGKPVIVREGGATKLPPKAAAQYTDLSGSSPRRPKNLYSREYTVYAKVSEPKYTPTVSPESGKLPQVSETANTPQGYDPETAIAPQALVASNFVLSQDNSTGQLLTTTTQFKPTGNETILNPPKNSLQVTNLNLEVTGQKNIQEGKYKIKKGDYTGILQVYAGVSQRFNAGFIRGLKGAKEQPAETLLAAAAYGVVGYFTGGAGVGTLYAAQNVYEFKTGTQPHAVKFVKDPVGTSGEVAPFVVAGLIAGEGAAAVRSRAATVKARGNVLTKDLVVDYKPQTDLTVTVRADPVVALYQDVITKAEGGVQRGVGVKNIKYGEPEYLTRAEILKAPETFITDTTATTITRTRPKEGSFEFADFLKTEKTGNTFKPTGEKGYKFLDQVSEPAQTTSVTGTTRGRTTVKEVQEAADFYKRVDVRKSDIPATHIVETISRSETRFAPYDMPPAFELTVPKSAQARAKGPTRAKAAQLEKKGGSLDYEPKLDYFEEFTIESQGTSVTIRESPYTGARDVSITPYTVSQVLVRPSSRGATKTASKGAGVSASSSGINEVEIKQSDGTVLIQKQKVEFTPEPPIQKTKQKTETKQETKQKTKQKTKTVQEQRQEAASKQTKSMQLYTFKKPSGASVSEAIVKFKSIQKTSSRFAVLGKTLSGQKSRQLQELSQAQQVAQKQHQATAQVLAFSQAQNQDLYLQQAQESRQAQEIIQKQQLRTVIPYIRPPSRTFGRPGLPETTPIVPIINNVPKRKKRRDEGYDVLVKRRGRFQKVGRNLGFKEASLKGAAITKTTSAASFKLSGSKPARSRSILGVIGRQFRKSKATPNVIVERSKFRIDSAGELGEITRKGQAVSRKKTKKTRRRKYGIFGKFAA